MSDEEPLPAGNERCETCGGVFKIRGGGYTKHVRSCLEKAAERLVMAAEMEELQRLMKGQKLVYAIVPQLNCY